MNTLEIRLAVEHDTSASEYLVAHAVIDGAVFGDGRYLTSLAALRSSLERDGIYHVLTCTCGVPECAGLETGVMVAHRRGAVEWMVREPGSPRTYVFDADTYRSVIEHAMERAGAIMAAAGRARSRVTVVPLTDEPLFGC